MKFGRLISAVVALACSAFMAVPVANATETDFDAEFTGSLDVWQFEGIDIEKWNTGLLKFDYAVDGEEGITTTEGIIVKDFIEMYASEDKKQTILSGESTINFAIIVEEDIEGVKLTNVYIEPKVEEVLLLATGEFEVDAEIDDSEYLEIGSLGFEVE